MMWLFLSDAFVSVVASDGSNRLKVRARKKKHLQALFPRAKIHESRNTDYRFRVFVSRKAFAKLIASRIENIDYTNYKNSVSEKAYHDLVNDVWFLHHSYQFEGMRKRYGSFNDYLFRDSPVVAIDVDPPSECEPALEFEDEA